MIKVDFTALSDFQRCPQFYKWRHLCHLKPLKDEAAPLFGICIHKGIETYQNFIKGGHHDEEAALAAYRCFDDLWDWELYEEFYKNKKGEWVNKENGRHRKAAKAIFEAYKNFPSRTEFEPKLLEQYKEKEWFSGLTYSGWGDQIGVHKDFKYRLGWDLKVHGNNRNYNIKIDAMSKQYQGYCWLFDVDHWLVEHVSVRAATREEVKTGKHKSGKELELFNGYVVDVERVDIVRDVDYLDSIAFELTDFQDRLIKYKNLNYFPRNEPNACTHFNKPCSYLKLCLQNVKENSDFTISDSEAENFEREAWNPAKKPDLPLTSQEKNLD